MWLTLPPLAPLGSSLFERDGLMSYQVEVICADAGNTPAPRRSARVIRNRTLGRRRIGYLTVATRSEAVRAQRRRKGDTSLFVPSVGDRAIERQAVGQPMTQLAEHERVLRDRALRRGVLNRFYRVVVQLREETRAGNEHGRLIVDERAGGWQPERLVAVHRHRRREVIPAQPVVVQRQVESHPRDRRRTLRLRRDADWWHRLH